MAKNQGYSESYAKASRIIYRIMWLIGMLLILSLLIFVVLKQVFIKILSFLFDGDYEYKFAKGILDAIRSIIGSITGSSPFSTDWLPHTNKWSESFAHATSNSGAKLMLFLFICLVVLAIAYTVTIIMRHHYGEMAPFLNDSESRKVKRKIIRKIDVGYINRSNKEKNKQKSSLSKFEKKVRRHIRRKLKVRIHTYIPEDSPVAVKHYHIRIRRGKTTPITEQVTKRIKDLHTELTDITGSVKFDQQKSSENFRYFIFEGSKEKAFKEAKSVVKQREATDDINDTTNDNSEDVEDSILQFPLSIFEDNSGEIEAQEAAAQKFAESKIAKISTYFSSINMSVEYLKCNVGKTSVEYVYTNRFGNSTRSENSLQQELSVELADNSIIVTLESKYIKINLPLPEGKRVQIDTRKTFKENLSNAKEPTETIWGLTVENEMFVAPLAESPHVLVAGMTNSGKSVWLNSMLLGMLAHATPDELKLAIIDPKRNEFTDYKGLPHNITDPITDMENAETFLRYIEQIAEERYKIFEKTGKKNIYRYNKWAEKNGEEKLPFIVTVVDEWNNLRKQSQESAKPLEGLGEKARAAGVHVIIATQRPSADVLDGTIKANLPTKVALSVDTAINSRIILEREGAEKLNGYGDMYIRYKANDSLIRAQGLYIKDEEITEVTDYLKNKFDKPNYVDYQAYMRRFDGEDEENNETFGAVNDLQQTRLDIQQDNGSANSSNDEIKSDSSSNVVNVNEYKSEYSSNADSHSNIEADNTNDKDNDEDDALAKAFKKREERRAARKNKTEDNKGDEQTEEQPTFEIDTSLLVRDKDKE